ncbi:MAG TPA: vanadium-dependent haloperoxidase [Candidatus Krumholzibacteria bacterium]|nr:vanadium-dependent haloperoxidase [Candidatus Krumholzibacteria bacterium]
MKRPHRVLPVLLILLQAAVFYGCSNEAPSSPGAMIASDASLARSSAFVPGESVANLDADLAVAWFNVAYGVVQTERLTPPVASRAFGYLGVTLYESLLGGLPEHASLAGQLNGLGALPRPNGKAYHWPLVANRAMATIMRQLLPAASQPSLDAIASLESQLAGEYGAGVPAGVVARSNAFGESVALAIHAWSTEDGYTQYRNCAYTYPSGPGFWKPTPPAFAAPLEPCWGNLRPFVMANGSVCDPGAPVAYSETPGSACYVEALEVYDVVNGLTPDQLLIAEYWADNPGQTGTPPGHSMSIVGQVVTQYDLPLGVAVEAYAKVGVAVADAFISCWWVKYEYNLLRPISYILDVIDPAWPPTPVATPPFPEYTSGHSVQSGATAQVLTDMFGDLPFTDRTHEDRGLAARSFASFFEFADEAAISRLYGGIHYRSAIVIGVEQGRCIGNEVSALETRGQAPLAAAGAAR